MKQNKICAVIVDDNLEEMKKAEKLVDLFEIRIDLIGEKWREIVRQLKKPWLATCRRSEDKGGWRGTEAERVRVLFDAVNLGAGIVDIEIGTPGLKEIVPLIKKQAKCLISYHNFESTPDKNMLIKLVQNEIDAGADICKIVTTATTFDDNVAVLSLIREFPKNSIIAFTMGTPGAISRVLCPLIGGYFTYASVQSGKESAPGQFTVDYLFNVYELLKK